MSRSSFSSSSIATEEEEDVEDYVQGGYHFVKIGDEFSDGRYIVVRKLGWGHSSTVWGAKDTKMKRYVALKVVKSAPRYTKRALDEIKLLQRLVTSSVPPTSVTPQNPNPPPSPSHTHPGRSHVVSFLDHFRHKGPNGTHIVMVFEVLGENLLELMKRCKNKGVPVPLVKQIAKQVLLGLDYMHRCCGIIHTNLTPTNILICLDDVESAIRAESASASLSSSPTNFVDSTKPPLPRHAPVFRPANSPLSLDIRPSPSMTSANSPISKPTETSPSGAIDGQEKITVKIADLRNATWVEHHFTDDIQTRQYRCPEVILGAEWGSSADVWSVACVIFELLTVEYLFNPASGAKFSKDDDHIAQIIELIGDIPKSIAFSGKHSHVFFNPNGELRHIDKLRFWSLDAVLHEKYRFPKEHANSIASFLTPMLHLHPDKRMSANDLIHHNWLDGITVQGEIDVIRRKEENEVWKGKIATASNSDGRELPGDQERERNSVLSQSQADAVKSASVEASGELSWPILGIDDARENAMGAILSFSTTLSPFDNPEDWLGALQSSTFSALLEYWRFEQGTVPLSLALLKSFLPYPRLLTYTFMHLHRKHRSRWTDLIRKLGPWGEWDELTFLSEHQTMSNALFGLLLLCRKNCLFKSDFITAEQLDQILFVDITNICVKILLAQQNSGEKALVENVHDSEHKAQKILDLLQALLDWPHLDSRMRPLFIRSVCKLSKKSGLHPQSIVLTEVQVHGQLSMSGGSYGDIWKGTVHGDSVCVKVMRVFGCPTDVEKLRKLFALEAVIWKQLSHPNILPFLGIHIWLSESPRVCLVSPWLVNGNVMDFLGRFPETDRLKMVLDIADGLKYLHNFSPQIVHGDIKGVNVLVTSTLRACLADFGLASMVDSGILGELSKSTRHAGGTLRWQAPELMDDESNGNTLATDIYAFACTCYEILSGRKPFFERMKDTSVMLAVMEGKRPSRPRESTVEDHPLNDEMWAFIESGWKQAPAERYTATGAVEYLKTLVARTANYHGDYQQRSLVRSPLGKPSVFGMPNASNLMPVFPTLKGAETLRNPVASGGFSDIWKASVCGHAIAVKVPRIYQKVEVKEHLLFLSREYEIMVKLNHQNILPMYGMFFWDDHHSRVCLVMPWMENGSVPDFLRNFPGEIALDLLVSDIVNGVAYLHSNNPPIIHGDLKAANVLLTESRRACLTGFELSAIADSRFSSFSHGSSPGFHGSARWQAPELLMLDPELEESSSLGKGTTSSDIYSLACVLYEVYSGKVPLYTVTNVAIAVLQVSRGLRPSRTTCFASTDEVWALIQDCWAQMAQSRPSVDEVIKRLQSSPSFSYHSPDADWDQGLSHLVRSLLGEHRIS